MIHLHMIVFYKIVFPIKKFLAHIHPATKGLEDEKHKWIDKTVKGSLYSNFTYPMNGVCVNVERLVSLKPPYYTYTIKDVNSGNLLRNLYIKE